MVGSYQSKHTTIFSRKVALILSLLLSLGACSNDKGKQDDSSKSEQQTEQKTQSKQAQQDKQEKPPIPVEIAKVVRGDIQQTYRTITTLQAEREVAVVARSSGILKQLNVEEGDKVKAGQILAQLDTEQLRLEVARLKATTQKLRKELERQESLFRRNLTSRDALDRARYEYEAQNAQLELSRLKLNYATIRAPFDGVVIERHIKPGNFVRDNDKLFQIADLSKMQAPIFLPEKEMPHVKVGQRVWLGFDATGGAPRLGHIERIQPAVDTATGTFKAVAALDNPDLSLKTGMFGKVELVFDEHKNSLLLERQAIITQDNKEHVFVIRDGVAYQTPISIGFKRDGYVEVVSGLQEADEVVVTGQQLLKHEAKVEILNPLQSTVVEERMGPASAKQAVAQLP